MVLKKQDSVANCYRNGTAGTNKNLGEAAKWIENMKNTSTADGSNNEYTRLLYNKLLITMISSLYIEC
jgi:hypothetical protein